MTRLNEEDVKLSLDIAKDIQLLIEKYEPSVKESSDKILKTALKKLKIRRSRLLRETDFPRGRKSIPMLSIIIFSSSLYLLNIHSEVGSILLDILSFIFLFALWSPIMVMYLRQKQRKEKFDEACRRVIGD